MMQGALVLASAKIRRMLASDSPTTFDRTLGPFLF